MIAEKRVTANDKTVTDLRTAIDPETDVVRVDGVVASPVDQKIYVALNKTRMTMTTLFDPFKRRTVVHYLGKLEQRVYPVGRLDFDAEGLLLLTNDGDLAYRLAHPKYQVPKIYEARVQGQFTREAGERIQSGLRLDDGATGRAEVSILGFVSDSTRIRLVLTEGRKHEVKQLCKMVGHPVKHLRRVEFAGISVRNLKPGQWRYLTTSEVDQLRSLVGLD